MGAVGLLAGMLKYGRSNFRPMGAKASIYYDGCRRHLARWFEGEDLDPDDGVPHLGLALANLAILIEAQAAGTLVDDRMYPGGYFELVEELTPHIARLRAKYSETNPHHFSRTSDNQVSDGAL